MPELLSLALENNMNVLTDGRWTAGNTIKAKKYWDKKLPGENMRFLLNIFIFKND